MAHWVNKSIWVRDSHNTNTRRSGKDQTGTSGNGYAPTVYKCRRGNFSDAPRQPNGAYAPVVDVPAMTIWQTLYDYGADGYPAARNKAWSALVNDVRKGPANLGPALAEWPESLSMVASRASQLYRGYRDLRKGDFRGFLKTFGVSPQRKHRNVVRSRVNQASSLWLEYSFGWSPLFKDIYDGVHAVGEPLPGGRCSGSGRIPFKVFQNTSSITTTGYVCVKQGAYVTVSNPNTYALQQLGLANPLSIAWEVVPFSFVVDWVFDVGTALGGLTDLLGCSVQLPYNTAFLRGFSEAVSKYPSNPPRYFYNRGPVSGVNRRLGLSYPMPNVSYHANIGSSLKRAANAVSLLGQILTK